MRKEDEKWKRERARPIAQFQALRLTAQESITATYGRVEWNSQPHVADLQPSQNGIDLSPLPNVFAESLWDFKYSCCFSLQRHRLQICLLSTLSHSQTELVLWVRLLSFSFCSLLIRISALIIAAPCLWPQHKTWQHPRPASVKLSPDHIMRKKRKWAREVSVPSFYFLLRQRGWLSLPELMLSQCLLDVNATYEVCVCARARWRALLCWRAIRDRDAQDKQNK